MTRRQDRRDQDRGIRTREVGAESFGIQRANMPEALTFGEKEPASGQESPGSERIRAGESWIRKHQGGRVLDLKASGREKPRSGDVRTQRPCTRYSQDTQDVGLRVGMASGRTAISNAKSGRNVGSMSCPDS